MKKLLGVAMLTVMVASFTVGAISSTVQSKPVAYDCTTACNRTTYRLIECCKYDVGSATITKCQFIGYCYPE
jgi:hypothetical protein